MQNALVEPSFTAFCIQNALREERNALRDRV